MKKEIWKDVLGYEGLYKVSNLGSIKSLSRIVNNGYNSRCIKERILKLRFTKKEYCNCVLYKNGIRKQRLIHQLVAESFLNHKPCGMKLVINHIDINPKNNNVDNLEIVTSRENGNQKHLKSTSKYIGVHWDKIRNKWKSEIWINGKNKYLGRFINEIDASKAYQIALNNI